jgi:hypothetical protein
MPRILKRPSRRSSVPPVEQPGLVALDDLPPSRRPYGSKNMAIGIAGRISTDAGVFAQILRPEGRLNSTPMPARDNKGDDDSLEDDSYEEDDIIMDEVEGVRNEGEARRQAGKKERQWRNWSEEVIPAMLEPYMELLRETDLLKDLSSVRKHQGCKGCGNGRYLEVVCVYFESTLQFLMGIQVHLQYGVWCYRT